MLPPCRRNAASPVPQRRLPQHRLPQRRLPQGVGGGMTASGQGKGSEECSEAAITVHEPVEVLAACRKAGFSPPPCTAMLVPLM